MSDVQFDLERLARAIQAVGGSLTLDKGTYLILFADELAADIAREYADDKWRPDKVTLEDLNRTREVAGLSPMSEAEHARWVAEDRMGRA